MTVEAGKTPYHSYFPGSAMAAEAIPFDFGSVDDLRVEAVGGSAQVYGTDYTITGDPETGTASITALVDAGDAKWHLWSETARTQQINLQETRVLPLPQYERELDRRARIEREIDHTVARTLKVARGDSIGEIPALADRKGKYWLFDAETGDPSLDDPDNFAAPARAAAEAAATSAGFAEEFTRPAYATVEAGEAATAEGQFFRVPIADTDPVEYTRYQRTADGSVEAAPLATTAALASTDSSKGAALVAGAGKTIATRSAMAALTSAADLSRPLQLIEAGREGLFIWDSSDLSTEIAADAAQGVYVPPTFDTTGESGAWVRQIDGVLRPEWFGDVDTPATANEAIQAAIDLTEYVDAEVVIGNRRYETQHPLYAVDNLHMRGEGPKSEIYNSYAGGGTTQHTLIAGEMHPLYLASNTEGTKQLRVTWDKAGAIVDGSRTLTLDTAGNAANYSVGDKVTVRSRAYRAGATTFNELPHYAVHNIVASADSDTGVVTFEYPLVGPVPYDSATITGAADNGSGAIRITATGHGFDESHPVTITDVEGTTEANGTWAIDVIDDNHFDLRGSAFASAYTGGGTAKWGGSYICNWTTEHVAATSPSNPDRFAGFVCKVKIAGVAFSNLGDVAAVGRTSLLDCDLDFRSDSRTPASFNATCYSRIKVTGTGTDRAVEIKCFSARSYFDIDLRVTDPNLANVVSIGECARMNTIDLSLDCEGGGAEALIALSSACDNTVNLRRVDAREHTSTLINMTATAASGASDDGESQDATRDNTVNVNCTVVSDAPTRVIYFRELAAGFLTNNTVRGGRFASTPTTNALLLEGSNHTVETHIDSGIIHTSGATGATLRLSGDLRLNNYTPASAKDFILNGVPQYCRGEAIEQSGTTHNLDFTYKKQTVTFSGASLQLGAPVNTGSVGHTIWVTLVNNSGGAVTPTNVANISLGPNSWAEIADGESVTFEMVRVPSASGAAYAIRNLTDPA